MTRKEAIEMVRKSWPISRNIDLRKALETLIPELRESEDERITRAINNMLPFIPDEAYANNGVTKEDVLTYLEKQKEQKPDDDPLNDPKFIKGFDTGREVQRIFDEQKPAEWSEEDEEKINSISEIIEHCITIPYSGGTLTLSKEHKKELQCFLKSIRPSWKPSEEQIKALKYAAYHMLPGEEYRDVLFSLFKDLKKLM